MQLHYFNSKGELPMYKIISVLLAVSVVITLLLCGCSTKTVEEETTEDSAVISVIDRSNPVTKGNLITKTSTDENGKITVDYYDSDDNLVESFVWDDDKNVSHVAMSYSDSGKLAQKENISSDGKSNVIESYQYDESGNIQKKTVSEFENGNIKVSTVYDADNQKIRYSLSSYNENDKIAKIESYDKNDKLEEYYTYDYNDKNQTVRYSVYDADSKIKKYTTFEYNEDGALSGEKFYNKDDVLEQYYVFTYYESGQMKSSSYYDGKGNLISEDLFEDTTG